MIQFDAAVQVAEEFSQSFCSQSSVKNFFILLNISPRLISSPPDSLTRCCPYPATQNRKPAKIKATDGHSDCQCRVVISATDRRMICENVFSSSPRVRSYWVSVA